MYKNYYESIISIRELNKVKKSAIYSALRDACVSDNEIGFFSYGNNGKKIDFLAISDLRAFSQYDSSFLLTIANIRALQKEYALPIVVNEIPDTNIFIMADSKNGNKIDINGQYAVLFKVNMPIKNDCSDTAWNILNHIKDLKNYPAILDADTDFLNMEYEIKDNYLSYGWIEDIKHYFAWEWEWLMLYNDGELLEDAYSDNGYNKLWTLLKENGLSQDTIDNLYDSCNVVDCHADINTENTYSVKCAKEIQKTLRHYILKLRYERINGWRKNQLTLPGIEIKDLY